MTAEQTPNYEYPYAQAEALNDGADIALQQARPGLASVEEGREFVRMANEAARRSLEQVAVSHVVLARQTGENVAAVRKGELTQTPQVVIKELRRQDVDLAA